MNISVHLIEDDTDYTALVLAWLSPQIQSRDLKISWTDSLSTSLDRLAEGGIDLILMDLGLPDSTGLATLAAVRAKAPGLPIVILSGSDEEALALEAIQQGAQDYLIKPGCSGELLLRTLRRAAVRHRSTSNGPAKVDKSQGRVVGVLGSAGGVGTTTIAAILAAELGRQSGQKALLLDLDLSPGMTPFFTGIDPQFSVRDALQRADELDPALWQVMVTPCEENLDVLGAGRENILEEPELAAVQKLLAFGARMYGWIVVDLGRLNHLSKRVMRWADDRLLVTGSEISSLHQCKRALEILELANIGRDGLRLVLNRKHSVERLSPRDVSRLFGVEINVTFAASHADLYKACLSKTLPPTSCHIRNELAALARQLAGVPDSKAKPRSGLISMFRELTEANAK